MAVQMRIKGYALFGDLAQFGQTEYLKSTAVRQNGPIPAGKFVQPSQISHHLVPGTQVQMVGVAQHNLCADLLQIQCR